MTFEQDRGTILQVTFQILYPNGQVKTVTMPLSDTSEFKDVGMIILNEDMLYKYITGRMEENKSEAIVSGWNSNDIMEDGEEAPFKPALALVTNNGDVILKCGGHRSSGHIEKGATTVYM